MTARLKGRRREVTRLLSDLEDSARTHPDIAGVVLVGSYARGTEGMASDVDVVVLAEDPDSLADSSWLLGMRDSARLIRSRRWGPVRERRYRLPCGLIVELGFAPVSWAAIPLDAGTRRVLADGNRIIYDTGVLGAATDAAR